MTEICFGIPVNSMKITNYPETGVSMFIRDMFKNGKNVISFEVFPPKKEDDIEKLYETVTALKSVNPDYVSVTFGAGGSTRDRSSEISSFIKNRLNIEVMSHLTCVNSTREDISSILDQLKKNNIDNVLALRGDPPQGQTNFSKTIGGFGYASELTGFIKSRKDFSIGVAGYPEGHIENRNLDTDVDFLKVKVDSGADFIITQLFYDNTDFYRFRDIAVKKGIKIPIVPGIFPIMNLKAIQKITSLCGSAIPETLNCRLMEHSENHDEVVKIGIDYAIKQIDDLLDHDIPGVHFYTMNKSHEIISIYNAVKSRLKRI